MNQLEFAGMVILAFIVIAYVVFSSLMVSEPYYRKKKFKWAYPGAFIGGLCVLVVGVGSIYCIIQFFAYFIGAK